MNLITILILVMVTVIIYVGLVSLFTLLFRVTGLSKTKAFFQTISLFTGVGFTTVESETITCNPVRRRIALSCMIVGNLLSILVITLLINIISSFKVDDIRDSWQTLAIAGGVFVLILVFFNLPFIAKPLENIVRELGTKFYTSKTRGNVISILDNYSDDCIAEVLIVKTPELLKNKTLMEANIKHQYGINVMFVRRRKKNMAVNRDTIIQEGDKVVVFGHRSAINAFFTVTKQEMESSKTEPISNSVYILENYAENAMAEVHIITMPETLKSKPLFETDIKTKYDINVILLKRNGKLVSVNKNTKLKTGDTIVVFGPFKNIQYLFETLPLDNDVLETKTESD